MKAKEVQATVVDALERNLGILLGEPQAVYRTGETTDPRETFVRLSDLRALHAAVAANVAQGLMGQTIV